jgi:preprotein translocase subunit SecB
MTKKITLNSQYLKDLSFESPNSPYSIPKIAQNPNISFNVDINAGHLGNGNFEVILSITASAILNDKDKKDAKPETIFITEVKYAGLFSVDAKEEELQEIILIDCPTLIFPFARRIIADATRDGGFPPLMMDPIDFRKLYEDNKDKTSPTIN